MTLDPELDKIGLEGEGRGELELEDERDWRGQEERGDREEDENELDEKSKEGEDEKGGGTDGEDFVLKCFFGQLEL